MVLPQMALQSSKKALRSIITIKPSIQKVKAEFVSFLLSHNRHQLIKQQSIRSLISSKIITTNKNHCPLYKQSRLTSLAKSLCTPPRIEQMACQKVLNSLSSCLRMNVMLLHKITLNYNVLHLLSRHPQSSLLPLTLLVIDNLFPHSWQPPVSLVLFWETR